MRNTLYLMSFGIGAALLLGTQTQAQAGNCADHSQVVSRLGELYGENRQSIRLGDNNAVIEVFASPATGSWTITVTQPGELTCMVAAGQAYQYLNEPLANFDRGT